MYPVKSKEPSVASLVKSTQILFRQVLGVILETRKKNQVSTLKKIWVDFTGYPSNHF
jgi:hypothetical protein